VSSPGVMPRPPPSVPFDPRGSHLLGLGTGVPYIVFPYLQLAVHRTSVRSLGLSAFRTSNIYYRRLSEIRRRAKMTAYERTNERTNERIVTHCLALQVRFSPDTERFVVPTGTSTGR